MSDSREWAKDIHNIMMSDFTQDIIALIKKHDDCVSIAEDGAIIIKTCLMYDRNGKIIPWMDTNPDGDCE
jgi:hypothetical protein